MECIYKKKRKRKIRDGGIMRRNKIPDVMLVNSRYVFKKGIKR